MVLGYGCSVCLAQREAQVGAYSLDQVFIIPGKHELFCVRHKPDEAVPYYEFLRRK